MASHPRSQQPNYVIISPVKDEEEHIEKTLHSIVSQTVQPLSWIIIDDGSTDRTWEVAKRCVESNDFIKLVQVQRNRPRDTGIAEIIAFNEGLRFTEGFVYDYLVKLDGDLSLEAHYFERLLAHFEKDPKLGIASGVYLEKRRGTWREMPMPPYHAAGASKVVRRTCFEQIGGFMAERGWDTVDEIRAMAMGWRTTHFPELKVKHWKPEGTGMGVLRTECMHGEIYYRTGGGKIFLVLKILNRLLHRPLLVGGLAMAFGYVRALFKGSTPLVSNLEARGYRALLNSRITGYLKRLQPLSS